MNERVKRLVRYAEDCGFELAGRTGSGHYMLRHSNGAHVTIAATPGERRGDANARAAMRRLSGVRPEKHRAASYLKALPTPPAAAPAEERVESVSARYAALAGQHRRLCDDVRRYQRTADAEGERAAALLLDEVESMMRQLGRKPPLRACRLAPGMYAGGAS